MKKYIRYFWILIGVSAAICPLFTLFEQGKIFYLLLNALSVGWLNLKAVEYVMDIATKCGYPELEELKSALYTKSANVDPATTPRVLMQEVEKHNLFYKINYIDVIVILLLTFFVLNGGTTAI